MHCDLLIDRNAFAFDIPMEHRLIPCTGDDLIEQGSKLYARYGCLRQWGVRLEVLTARAVSSKIGAGEGQFLSQGLGKMLGELQGVHVNMKIMHLVDLLGVCGFT